MKRINSEQCRARVLLFQDCIGCLEMVIPDDVYSPAERSQLPFVIGFLEIEVARWSKKATRSASKELLVKEHKKTGN